ncbi:MAG TPA: formate dehydrogenase accessory sulfurtransferase FdhD [Acidobacteriota bacterium]|nr:formate dehydrogenase accessory sulfurtransferase FdhD [Acidobacteriota bacterium]
MGIRAEDGGTMLAPSRSIDVALVCEWHDGQVRRFADCLANEEPLEIRVGDFPLSVTMRTPGHDFELAAGFLFTEGVIQGREQLGDLRQGSSADGQPSSNVVQVELAGVLLDRDRMQRNFFVASSCGICGKASIDAVRAHGIRCPSSEIRFDPDLLCTLPEALRSAQAVFGQTGGLHAAALFDSAGKLIVLREDVGRHNAVDKVIGWALLEGRIPLSENVLMVSGRGGFEIIQKALMAGIPAVSSVSAPSSLAVKLARELGLTLVGFLRGRRFLVYSGEERLNLNSEKVEADR